MSKTKQPMAKRATPLYAAAPADAAPPPDVEETAPAALPVPVPEPLPLPAPLPRAAGGDDRFAAACRTTLASIGRSQTAIAADITAMALEVAGLARANLTAAGDGMTALLGAKGLTDAVEIQLALTRRGLDAFVAGATRLSEIALHLANEATKPVVTPFGSR